MALVGGKIQIRTIYHLQLKFRKSVVPFFREFYGFIKKRTYTFWYEFFWVKIKVNYSVIE